MAQKFKLPEVGENVEAGIVVRLLVSEGDFVEEDQTVLELETDKATLEVPSTVHGQITSMRIKEGEELKVGATVFVVTDGGADAPSQGEAETSSEPGAEAAAPGPTEGAPEAEPSPAAAALHPPRKADTLPGVTVPASPTVRRLAREIGVDISEVHGRGPGGRITHDDVKAHAREHAVVAHTPGGEGGTPVLHVATATPMPDFSKWGPVEAKRRTHIRRVIGERMSHSWLTVPHVHQYAKADITELERMRREFNSRSKASGNLTLTTIAVKVVARLLERYPSFNSSLDETKDHILYKKYYNIGVAADTDRGLVVPVVRGADRKNIRELITEIDRLAATAREGKLTPDQMQGGTFTISNLGGIGGTWFNPIINYPEVAILGLARADKELKLVDGKVAERLMLPICVGYDHRVIDGAEGARFTRDLAAILTDPVEMLLEL
jgi:pyruvate dehydrogenase E2 component (dihydrolipoyllysine-residue acetyltransferase)